MSEQDIKINTLEVNYKNMSEKIDDLKDTVIIGFDKIEKRFENFVIDADKKYASKLTEIVVYGLVGIVLTSFIAGLIIVVWK